MDSGALLRMLFCKYGLGEEFLAARALRAFLDMLAEVLLCHKDIALWTTGTFCRVDRCAATPFVVTTDGPIDSSTCIQLSLDQLMRTFRLKTLDTIHNRDGVLDPYPTRALLGMIRPGIHLRHEQRI